MENMDMCNSPIASGVVLNLKDVLVPNPQDLEHFIQYWESILRNFFHYFQDLYHIDLPLVSEINMHPNHSIVASYTITYLCIS